MKHITTVTNIKIIDSDKGHTTEKMYRINHLMTVNISQIGLRIFTL